MIVVAELPEEQHAALVEYLRANGIQPSYDSALGQALETLVNDDSEAVAALQRIVALLGRNGGGRGRTVADTAGQALEIAQATLATLGVEP